MRRISVPSRLRTAGRPAIATALCLGLIGWGCGNGSQDRDEGTAEVVRAGGFPLGPDASVDAGGAAPAERWWEYPAEDAIRTADTSGDPFLITVNKAVRLPSDYVPEGLAIIPADVVRTLRPIRVRRELLPALRALNAAARAEGVDLAVLSGFRSYRDQEQVYRGWVAAENGDASLADRYSARPGHSEHQLGTTVDFTTAEINDGIGPAFNSTRAAAWLNGHAEGFGFRLSYPEGAESRTGYMHEGWHWRFFPGTPPEEPGGR